MPLDALYMTALRLELQEDVVGARIDKVTQPGRDEIVLQLRGATGKLLLLLSANPARPRMHRTNETRENPEKAPMFCMLLRKHIGGGRITALRQPPLERVFLLQIESRNELGDLVEKSLVLEAMGRHANLILLDETGRIVDCVRRVSEDMLSERQLLPGLFYRPPTDPAKCDIRSVSTEAQRALLTASAQAQPMERFLMQHCMGISPLIARELALDVGGSVDALVGTKGEALLARLAAWMDGVEAGQAQPHILYRDEKASDFAWRPILQYGIGARNERAEGFSTLLDAYYAAREREARQRQRGQELLQTLKSGLARQKRKLEQQRRELQDTEKREEARIRGDLITANLYRLTQGQQSFTATNYELEGCPEVEVSLDPLKSPQQNAAASYKAYRRAKTAREHLIPLIRAGEEELRYLASVQESLLRTDSEADLLAIREELEEGGYVRKKRGKKGARHTESQPLRYHLPDGFVVAVGKNNLQNDRLTLREGERGDLWFHIKDHSGSHVVLFLAGREPTEAAILTAAGLAAYHSEGREGGKVAVDYTTLRHVKKPSGAKPGRVIYTNHTTLLVTPALPDEPAN